MHRNSAVDGRAAPKGWAALMAEVFVTKHAIDRYRERVEDVPAREAIRRLSGRAFQTAVDFGAPFVRLATGQRAMIRDVAIVTVIPEDQDPRKMWAMFDRGGARG